MRHQQGIPGLLCIVHIVVNIGKLDPPVHMATVAGDATSKGFVRLGQRRDPFRRVIFHRCFRLEEKRKITGFYAATHGLHIR